jgi:importin-5
LACNMIYSYSFDLGVHFFKYVEKVAEIMVPLLKFAYLEDIRESAGNIMPELLRCVKENIQTGKADEKELKKLFDFVLETLLDAIRVETEVGTNYILLESLHDCITIVYENFLSKPQIEAITKIFRKLIVDSMIRKKNLNEELENEEDEDEILNKNEEEQLEEQFLTIISEVTGTIMLTNENFIPYFDEVLWPVFMNMLNPKLQPEDNRIALCVICDFIEKGKKESTKYFEKTIFPALLKYTQSPHPEVVQAAVYGLGALAEHSGDDFSKISDNAIKSLVSVINHKDSKEKKFKAAICNAVSALFKVIKFQSKNNENINPDKLLEFWFSALPVSGDDLEACIVHGILVSLIQQNNKIILQQKNIPKIIEIFAEIVDTDDIKDDDQILAIKIIEQFQSSLGKEIFEKIVNNLSEEHRETLKSVLSE